MLQPAARRTLVNLTAMTAMCLTAVGCVQRTIHVTSSPSQALVYLNDEAVGRTPVTVPFTFYGTYDVRLEHEGYAPLSTKQKARAPWWEYPGPDLLAEAIPGAKSKINWQFDLNKQTPPGKVDVNALQTRARQLRTRSRQ